MYISTGYPLDIPRSSGTGAFPTTLPPPGDTIISHGTFFPQPKSKEPVDMLGKLFVDTPDCSSGTCRFNIIENVFASLQLLLNSYIACNAWLYFIASSVF